MEERLIRRIRATVELTRGQCVNMIEYSTIVLMVAGSVVLFYLCAMPVFALDQLVLFNFNKWRL